MKVNRVDNDSVYVSINEYVTTKRSGISQINKEENYMKRDKSIAKADLQQRFEEGMTYKADR
ncbi:MAG: hypothetical protein WBG62_09485 [Cyclobacteriaceae bacterium]